jgi:hypothetical protein
MNNPITIFTWEPECQMPGFAHGFTCGIIWLALSEGRELDMSIHKDLENQAQKLAEHHGYHVVFGLDDNPGYITAYFTPIDITPITII